jgi:addiction module HigA family antidote
MDTLHEIQKSLLSPPGDTIQETLEARGMTQAELAEKIGLPKEKLNNIIKGREPLSTETVYQFEKVLGIPLGFWINREKEYRRKLNEM